MTVWNFILFLAAKTFDVHGAVVNLTYDANDPEIPYKLRIQTPSMENIFEIGFKSQDLAVEWEKSIKEAAHFGKSTRKPATKKRANSTRC